jgi:hypothetical protein
MPIIDSTEVRLLRAVVLKILNDVAKESMQQKEYEYLKAEVEHAFARTLRMEVFSANP